MATDEKENLAAELASCAKALLKIAEAMGKEATKKEEPTEGKVASKESPSKEVTLEEVRAVLASKSRDGFTAEVRGLLQKHGAGKLSEVSPAEYGELLEEAEVLGHAG